MAVTSISAGAVVGLTKAFGVCEASHTSCLALVPSFRSLKCNLHSAPGFSAQRALRKVRSVSRVAAIAFEEAQADSDPADEFASQGDDYAPQGDDFAPQPNTKLYVGNLPWSTQSQDLAELFQDKAGNVELVEVIYNKETGRSRGFAFVTMSTEEEAQAAIDKLDNYDLDGRMLRVNFPQPRTLSDRPRIDRIFNNRFVDSESKLFVGNLSWSVSDDTLQELFIPYGKLREARVVYDRETGRSRGFGFVTFETPAEARRAMDELNGANHDGRALRVNPAGEKPPPRF